MNNQQAQGTAVEAVPWPALCEHLVSYYTDQAAGTRDLAASTTHFLASAHVMAILDAGTAVERLHALGNADKGGHKTQSEATPQANCDHLGTRHG